MIAQKRVLIVEDEPDVAESIQALLESREFVVSGIAKNQEEFEGQLKVTNPDVILLDINLQGETDGIDALALNREKCKDTPVIFLTGLSDSSTIKRASATNPSGYLVKPYREEELVANIEMALSRKMSEEEKTQAALGKFFHQSENDLKALLKEFALFLKTGRKRKGITQVNVAENLGINYRHYQDIEAGKINLRMETFLKLVTYFMS